MDPDTVHSPNQCNSALGRPRGSATWITITGAVIVLQPRHANDMALGTLSAMIWKYSPERVGSTHEDRRGLGCDTGRI